MVNSSFVHFIQCNLSDMPDEIVTVHLYVCRDNMNVWPMFVYFCPLMFGLCIISKPGRMCPHQHRRWVLDKNFRLTLAVTFQPLQMGFHVSYVHYLWQDLSHGTIIFYLVTLTLKFDLFNLTLTFAINFKSEEIELSYCTCVIPCDKTFHIVH